MILFSSLNLPSRSAGNRSRESGALDSSRNSLLNMRLISTLSLLTITPVFLSHSKGVVQFPPRLCDTHIQMQLIDSRGALGTHWSLLRAYRSLMDWQPFTVSGISASSHSVLFGPVCAMIGGSPGLQVQQALTPVDVPCSYLRKTQPACVSSGSSGRVRCHAGWAMDTPTTPSSPFIFRVVRDPFAQGLRAGRRSDAEGGM